VTAAVLVLWSALAAGAGGEDLAYRVAIVAPPGASLETMAARRSLQAMGIPFDVVEPRALAPHHPLALLPGPLANTTFSAADREAIYGYVSGGGLLVATQVEGSDWFPLFGVARADARRDRFRIRFDGVDARWMRYLDDPREREISLGDPRLFAQTIWSVAYALKGGRSLARFGGGETAATINDYDGGQAVALGVSLTQLLLASQVGQSFEAGRQWVNSFEPSGDAVLLLLRGIYESVARPAVRWHTVPAGLETAIVLSHDVDARESFENSLAFARMEDGFGVRSTFFINTKTFTDAADIGYYDSTRIPFLVSVRKLGFELGSHSVSHSHDFARFAFGERAVTARSYRPAQAPTVVGEVKVSKELLDRDLPGQETASFRAGELAFPPRLIEALELSGYRYDSTSSANNIITNFPFFALSSRDLRNARETPVVEVPVTVDDSRGFLTAQRLDEVTRIWSEIIDANRANGAMTCILIHPTDTTYKLEAERRILARYRSQPVWVGTVSALGEFWARRSAAGIRLERRGGALVARVDQPAGALRGLALAVGSPVAQVIDRAGKPVPWRAVKVAGQQLLVLGP
jgi:hypothetical protein